MRLAIADPPYLGKAVMLYGTGGQATLNFSPTAKINRAYQADCHPDAAEWDNPERHQRLVTELLAEYDGWAIAALPANLYDYLAWVPRRTRIAVWHNPRVMPTGSHPRRRWEAVLVYVPDGRRRVTDVSLPVGDVLTEPHPSHGFAGQKPAAWTRWVLAMLGYNPALDTVTDLFAGSGAVQAAIDQLPLPLT